MTSNLCKKSHCFQAMDILDVADGDNTVQINIDTTPMQEFHWHTNYSQTSASTSMQHTHKSVRTTMTHLPLGLSSGTDTGSNSLPTTISLQGHLASSRQDTLLATSMSTMSFLDPDHEAPAEFASASNEDKGMHLPRLLGPPIDGLEISGWTGSYFKKISLGDLGLIIQLGHKLGKTCQIPAIVRSFVVIDVDGIHTVQISFCECM
ncbi:hypothetical protein IW262DRAFT_1297789 [Armillaria fumosa]|nr:hypothetical protein IW262DRAFT_1297789 [Armillaria fumosa]